MNLINRYFQATGSASASQTANGNRTLVALLVLTPCLLTLAYGANDSASLLLLAALTILFASVWAVRTLRSREFEFVISPLYWPIVGLMLLGIVQLMPLAPAGPAVGNGAVAPSAALSFDPYATQIFLYRLLAVFVFFAGAVTFISTPQRLTRISIATTIFGGAIAFAAIIQRLASPDAIYGISVTPNAIPFGPYVNQHHFAALMVMLSGPVLAELTQRRRIEIRLLYLIAAVLMAVAVLLTGSRGGVLAYLTMVSVTGLLVYGDRSEMRAGRKWLIPGLAAVFVAAIVAGLAVFLGGDAAILRGFGLNAGEGDFTSGRLYFWSTAVKIFTTHPILGVGMDAFGVAFTAFDTRNGFYRVEQAHNDYLQMLTDGGIVGFSLAVAFIWLYFREVSRRLAETARDRGQLRILRIGAFAGCCGVLVHSFFDFPLRTWSNAWFFLLFVAIATVKLTDETADTENR